MSRKICTISRFNVSKMVSIVVRCYTFFNFNSTCYVKYLLCMSCVYNCRFSPNNVSFSVALLSAEIYVCVLCYCSRQCVLSWWVQARSDIRRVIVVQTSLQSLRPTKAIRMESKNCIILHHATALNHYIDKRELL